MLTIVVNKVADVFADLVFIGPTKMDFTMLPVKPRIQKAEAVLFRGWKELDLQGYYRSISKYRQMEFGG